MSYCKQGKQWERIGYIVKEALDEAIEASNITCISVKFEWNSSSGPGWCSDIASCIFHVLYCV